MTIESVSLSQPRYAPLFKKHGFDNTLFIAGMTETELRRIGVTSQGHLHFLLAQVTLIPAFEIEYKVPVSSTFCSCWSCARGGGGGGGVIVVVVCLFFGR